MKLQTAQNKIIKMLEKQNADNAIEEIKGIFSDVSILDIQRQQEMESSLEKILDKYELNNIAINIFLILEKVFSEDLKNKTFSRENYSREYNR